MNNAVLSYHLPTFTGFLNHAQKDVTLLRDTADDLRVKAEYQLDIQARSGDYFVTLATELDQLSHTVPDYRTRAAIEEVVSDLIYLQDNYTITNKADRLDK